MKTPKTTKIGSLLEKLYKRMFWGLIVMVYLAGGIYLFPTYHVWCSFFLTGIFITAMYLMFQLSEIKRDIMIAELMKDIDEELKAQFIKLVQEKEKSEK